MKIIIRNLQKNIPISPKRISSVVLKTLSLEHIRKSGEITILFTNDKQIRKLNLKYLGRNTSTDVLSFDNSIDEDKILADIAISTDTTIRNARIFKTTPLYELYLYVIHGVLHILGYDDRTTKQRKIMDDKTNKIFKTLHLHRYS